MAHIHPRDIDENSVVSQPMLLVGILVGTLIGVMVIAFFAFKQVNVCLARRRRMRKRTGCFPGGRSFIGHRRIHSIPNSTNAEESQNEDLQNPVQRVGVTRMTTETGLPAYTTRDDATSEPQRAPTSFFGRIRDLFGRRSSGSTEEPEMRQIDPRLTYFDENIGRVVAINEASPAYVPRTSMPSQRVEPTAEPTESPPSYEVVTNSQGDRIV